MPEWWTYTPGDFLMYSPRVYGRLLAASGRTGICWLHWGRDLLDGAGSATGLRHHPRFYGEGSA